MKKFYGVLFFASTILCSDRQPFIDINALEELALEELALEEDDDVEQLLDLRQLAHGETALDRLTKTIKIQFEESCIEIIKAKLPTIKGYYVCRVGDHVEIALHLKDELLYQLPFSQHGNIFGSEASYNAFLDTLVTNFIDSEYVKIFG